jgi:hypothetical protein
MGKVCLGQLIKKSFSRPDKQTGDRNFWRANDNLELLTYLIYLICLKYGSPLIKLVNYYYAS